MTRDDLALAFAILLLAFMVIGGTVALGRHLDAQRFDVEQFQEPTP